MTVKFVQYFVQGEEKSYRTLAELSKEINSKYCQVYNYKYQYEEFDKQTIVDEFGQFNWDMAVAYKMKFLMDHLNKQDCDYLVWIDADAAISKPTIKIEDLIDDKHQLFFSRGNDIYDQVYFITNTYDKFHSLLFKEDIYNEFYDQTLMKKYDLFKWCEGFSTNYIKFNEGLYIIKNTQKMRQFFTDCYNFMKNYVMQMAYDSFSAIDGRAIRYVLMLKKYQDIYVHLYDQSQGCLIGGYKMKYDAEKTFLMHNYGPSIPIEQRVFCLNQLKQNKWWKQVYDWSMDKQV